MADKISRDRSKDTSIKTDDLDLGSIDDISLDFPGSGDEGVEFGKSRKPSNPKKEFAVEFAKGLGGGVKSATMTELKRALPDGAAILSEAGAAIDDMKALKEDLARQLAPMTNTLEGAARKVLPKAEKYLPKKLYDKIHKKLEDRAAARAGSTYNAPSKAQAESDQIASELAAVFGAQMETGLAAARDQKKDQMIDRALDSTRHRQTNANLMHVYSAVRSTELFHRTQHMAYMKKSLELKYKHIFIARDTFNLLQSSMKTFEGYYKGILANTALPDMAKAKARDFIARGRTEMYGTMMANAMSNFRQKIFEKIKGSANDLMSQAGFLTDMIGMGADMSDMGMGGKDPVPGLLGQLIGFIGGGSKVNSLLKGKLAPYMRTLNGSFAGIRANAASRMSELQQKMAQSTNPILSAIADFLPNPMSQTRGASNDLLNKGKEAAAFDVVTRQSITEIIPGYLGKIWHEIAMMRTGNENLEERTFNVYERKFTTVGELRKDVYDLSFGDEKTRRANLTKTIGIMQAGMAANHPKANMDRAQARYKRYAKDINRVLVNHAQFGKTFKPKMLFEYVTTGSCEDMGYINSIVEGLENDPRSVLESITNAMFDREGNFSRDVANDLQLAITENFRKQDAWRQKMPDVMETFGYRHHFAGDLSSQEEKRLRELASKGVRRAAEELRRRGGLISSEVENNQFDFNRMADIRADINAGRMNVDRDADWTRGEAYKKYIGNAKINKEILSKLDQAGAIRLMQMYAGGKGWFGKTIGRFFSDDIDWMIDPELAKKNVDEMTEAEKARYAQGLAKAFGMSTHDEGADYRERFTGKAGFIDSGKPQKKESIFSRKAWSDLGRDARSMFGMDAGTSTTTTDEGKSVSESIKEAVSGAVDAAKTKAEEAIKDPRVQEAFSKAKAEIEKRKKQLEGTETGKKVIAQLEKLEQAFDAAQQKGQEGIKWLRDAGAFDHPTEFLKDCYGTAAHKVHDLTEDLPPLTDTTAWGNLINKKKDEAISYASSVASDFKESETGKKIISAATSAKDAATSAFNTAWDAIRSHINPTTGSIPPPEVTPLNATIGGGSSSGGVPPPDRPSDEGGSMGDRMDKLYSLLEAWKTENVENQGTIFDAIVQIDQDIKLYGAAGAAGAAGGKLTPEALEEYLQAASPSYRAHKTRMKVTKKIFGAAGAGIKGLGKLYAKTYGAALTGAGMALKGIGFAAGTAINKGFEALKATAKYLTEKPQYVDVYVKGKEGGVPLVTARKQKEEGIFRQSNGKRIESSADINEPCVDKDGNLVITLEDLATGLVIANGSRLGRIGAGALALGKKVIGGYFGVYGEAIKAIGSITKTVAQGLFGKAAERWQDIYRKDEVGKGPLVTARQQKEDGVYFFESGKKVERSSDIHEAVCDRDRKILISKEDIEHGIVNVDNKPLGSGATQGILRPIIRGIAGALPGIGKFVGKVGGNLMDIYGKGYRGLMDLGFGALKGAGRFLGRALGLNMGGLGGDGEKTLSILEKMQVDLATIAEHYKTKSGDKDGDGDIDGSYADQMQNKKDGKSDRVDARDKHVHTDWHKKEEDKKGGKDGEGSNWFGDLLGHLIPDKWARKWKVGKWLAKKRAGKWLGTAGRWLLGKGAIAKAGLGTAGRWLAGTAMPAVGSALGSAGSAIGGMLGSAGSALAGAIPGLGGLAGSLGSGLAAAGSAALPFLGPAALAALAGYGIYRGVKGFSKKNALENIGKSEGISNENQLTGEDRMYSALGMNTKLGAKAAKFASQYLGIHGLIKGIRGNDNPLTDKEIEQGRAKLQRKADKGLPGYDRMLQEYEKAVSAGNWKRARQLCGKEADGLIKSMWKNSIGGMAITGLGKLIFGNKDKEMTQEEIQKTRAKFESRMKKGGTAGKNAQKLLEKFDDAVAEGDWKKAREIAGAEQRGLFGKFFQDSKGNVQWTKVAGFALGGVVGYGVASLFTKADLNKPMTEEEVKKNRDRLQKLVNNGNKAAQKILDQFDEAVTEQDWKKARRLCGEKVLSNLQTLDKGLKSTVKWATRISTLGASMLFETDQEKPMTDEEIKKFTDRMNYLINKKNDKIAAKKLERFETAVAANKWEQARRIANTPHQSLAVRGAKAYNAFFWGDDDKEMSQQEIEKFRASMERKIKIGGPEGKAAQKKLDAFEDAVGRQKWRRARQIADAPNDGIYQKAGKWYAKRVASNWRFLFGGDGEPMSEGEIEEARKQFSQDIEDKKPGAQKRLDKFEDYVADEKWEKARQLAKMPYNNVVKRVGSAVGGWLFGSDKSEMSPEEIEKFQRECEQKISDGDPKANKILAAFNQAVNSENWKKAREISKVKDTGAWGTFKKAVNPFNWFKDDYEDCMEIKDELEEKSFDDETGLIAKGIEQFDILVRKQEYSKAMSLAKDILKMKPDELVEKHGLNSDEYSKILEEGGKLQKKIDKAIKREKPSLVPNMKLLKLQMLGDKLRSNSSKWGVDLFEEIDDDLQKIMGEKAYAGLDTDTAIGQKGDQLLKDIDEAIKQNGWIRHPLNRMKLNTLRNKVVSEPTKWTDQQLNDWRNELVKITGKDDSAPDTKEEDQKEAGKEDKQDGQNKNEPQSSYDAIQQQIEQGKSSKDQATKDRAAKLEDYLKKNTDKHLTDDEVRKQDAELEKSGFTEAEIAAIQQTRYEADRARADNTTLEAENKRLKEAQQKQAQSQPQTPTEAVKEDVKAKTPEAHRLGGFARKFGLGGFLGSIGSAVSGLFGGGGDKGGSGGGGGLLGGLGSLAGSLFGTSGGVGEQGPVAPTQGLLSKGVGLLGKGLGGIFGMLGGGNQQQGTEGGNPGFLSGIFGSLGNISNALFGGQKAADGSTTSGIIGGLLSNPMTLAGLASTFFTPGGKKAGFSALGGTLASMLGGQLAASGQGGGLLEGLVSNPMLMSALGGMAGGSKSAGAALPSLLGSAIANPTMLNSLFGTAGSVPGMQQLGLTGLLGNISQNQSMMGMLTNALGSGTGMNAFINPGLANKLAKYNSTPRFASGGFLSGLASSLGGLLGGGSSGGGLLGGIGSALFGSSGGVGEMGPVAPTQGLLSKGVGYLGKGLTGLLGLFGGGQQKEGEQPGLLGSLGNIVGGLFGGQTNADGTISSGSIGSLLSNPMALAGIGSMFIGGKRLGMNNLAGVLGGLLGNQLSANGQSGGLLGSLLGNPMMSSALINTMSGRSGFGQNLLGSFMNPGLSNKLAKYNSTMRFAGGGFLSGLFGGGGEGGGGLLGGIGKLAGSLFGTSGGVGEMGPVQPTQGLLSKGVGYLGKGLGGLFGMLGGGQPKEGEQPGLLGGLFGSLGNIAGGLFGGKTNEDGTISSGVIGNLLSNPMALAGIGSMFLGGNKKMAMGNLAGMLGGMLGNQLAADGQSGGMLGSLFGNPAVMSMLPMLMGGGRGMGLANLGGMNLNNYGNLFRNMTYGNKYQQRKFAKGGFLSGLMGSIGKGLGGLVSGLFGSGNSSDVGPVQPTQGLFGGLLGGLGNILGGEQGGNLLSGALSMLGGGGNMSSLMSLAPMLMQNQQIMSMIPSLMQNSQMQSMLPSLLSGGNLSGLLGNQNLMSLLGNQNLTSLLGNQNLTGLLSNPNITSLLSNSNVASLLSNPQVASMLNGQNLSGLQSLLKGQNLSGLLGSSQLSNLLGSSDISSLLSNPQVAQMLSSGQLNGLLGNSQILSQASSLLKNPQMMNQVTSLIQQNPGIVQQLSGLIGNNGSGLNGILGSLSQNPSMINSLMASIGSGTGLKFAEGGFLSGLMGGIGSAVKGLFGSSGNASDAGPTKPTQGLLGNILGKVGGGISSILGLGGGDNQEGGLGSGLGNLVSNIFGKQNEDGSSSGGILSGLLGNVGSEISNILSGNLTGGILGNVLSNPSALMSIAMMCTGGGIMPGLTGLLGSGALNSLLQTDNKSGLGNLLGNGQGLSQMLFSAGHGGMGGLSGLLGTLTGLGMTNSSGQATNLGMLGNVAPMLTGLLGNGMNLGSMNFSSVLSNPGLANKLAKYNATPRFANGGFAGEFATTPTSALDGDGNPILYGEAGTEAIMPLTEKPGNLLSRVGSKLGDILNGKYVGPMSDGSDLTKGSVHASDPESDELSNLMAAELAKVVRRKFEDGGFLSGLGSSISNMFGGGGGGESGGGFLSSIGSGISSAMGGLFGNGNSSDAGPMQPSQGLLGGLLGVDKNEGGFGSFLSKAAGMALPAAMGYMTGGLPGLAGSLAGGMLGGNTGLGGMLSGLMGGGNALSGLMSSDITKGGSLASMLGSLTGGAGGGSQLAALAGMAGNTGAGGLGNVLSTLGIGGANGGLDLLNGKNGLAGAADLLTAGNNPLAALAGAATPQMPTEIKATVDNSDICNMIKEMTGSMGKLMSMLGSTLGSEGGMKIQGLDQLAAACMSMAAPNVTSVQNQQAAPQIIMAGENQSGLDLRKRQC